LSMWISNTATTLMLIPIALSVARAEMGEDGLKSPFALALILGVAYAASIGGVATPVGTPTNLIAMGYLADNAGINLSFPQWMSIGVPAAALMIPASWWILTRLTFPVRAEAAHAGAAEVRRALERLGAMTTPETRIALVFACVGLSWMFRQPIINALGVPHLEAINGSQMDATIAIAGAIALFLIPAGSKEEPDARLMDWETTTKLPWGALLLFGGGFSLAAAIQATGLAVFLGESLSWLGAAPPIVMALVLVTVIIFLTEFTSNVATVTSFMPVIGAIAAATGADPLLLAAPAALAGSFAFMLPVATAPNAIVFATGHVSVAQMIRAGFRLNLIGIVIITFVGAAIAPVVLG
ncbi:MAG: DASS family sodium-coupled anion symporter, partial [Caulobacterales bacterium]|nr:DASS family sodium-coupled anion symporter [Caulobacterales bacterium]